MTQIIDPLPLNNQSSSLCCYVNVTNKIQIARITNISNWYFERVVFPGQRLIFEAPQVADLEIHTGMMASSILSDTIPCLRLVMDEDSNAIHDHFPGLESGQSTHKITSDEDSEPVATVIQ